MEAGSVPRHQEAVSRPGWLEQKALKGTQGLHGWEPGWGRHQAKEFVNNGEPLTVLVSNGEQTLRTDGINIGGNAWCS